MRPLSLTYVCLAMFTFSMMWHAYRWMNSDFDTHVRNSHHADDTGQVGPARFDLEMAKTASLGLASLCGGIFVVTVLGGEAYRYTYAGVKKVPVPPIPFSCVYVLSALLTAGTVIEAGYAFRGRAKFFRSENVTIDASILLLLAMVSAVAFITFAVAGEIYLERSRAKTHSLDETQTIQEQTVGV